MEGAKEAIAPGSISFEDLKKRQQEEMDAFGRDHPQIKIPDGLKEGTTDQSPAALSRP